MFKKYLIFGILILFVVNLIQAFFTPISEDEAYYWLWSQHLDWGYFDHPPMVAWWISVGYIFFQNELGVRFLTVLLNSLSFYFLWQILKPKIFPEIKLFFLVLSSILVIQVFGFLSTPDAPLLFFTILYLFSLQKFLKKNSIISTVTLSISFAGLMYSKYHGILVILFTLLPIMGFWWKNPKFYLAILGSLILYSPHINWLIQHDFLPIRYHFLERSADESFELRKLTNYIGIYILGAAPLLTYFIFTSIVKFKSKDAFQKSVWWLTALPGIFFFFSIFKDNVQPQWLLISFVSMGLLTYFHYSTKSNLRVIYHLGIISFALIISLRIVLMIPSISPFQKNKNFAFSVSLFNPINPIFEKYQEASVYKFYNTKSNVAVHRTLGNRKSQFNLWKWEENYFGETVTYISPWIKSQKSFIGYKNRDYHVKEIQNYQTFDLIEIETIETLTTKPNETIQLGLTITNLHAHSISVGKNTLFQLNVNYYKYLQYEIEYRQEIPLEKFTLQPGESKYLKITFKNTPKSGDYKACFGLNYAPIGTSYLSKPIEMKSY